MVIYGRKKGSENSMSKKAITATKEAQVSQIPLAIYLSLLTFNEEHSFSFFIEFLFAHLLLITDIYLLFE